MLMDTKHHIDTSENKDVNEKELNRIKKEMQSQAV